MKQVLIVDDEPEIAHLLQQSVAWEEYDFTIPLIAIGSHEALHILETEHIDLLVTDMRMPGMDGRELLEQVQTRWPAIKRLAISAFDEYEFIRGALKLGALDYLLKPVDINELEDILLTLSEEKTAPQGIEHQFTDQFLYRWIMGSIAPYELTERLEMAHIDVLDKHLCVCTMRIMSKESFSSEQLSHALQRVLYEPFSSYVCKEREDLYIILLLFPLEIEKESAVMNMQSVVQRIKHTCGIEVFVGVGSITADPQQVRTSYLLARRLVEHSILKPPGTVMDGKDSSLSETTFWYLSRIDFDSLQIMLRNRDETGAINFIIKMLNQACQITHNVSLDLPLIISEILVQISMTVNKFSTNKNFHIDQWYEQFQHIITQEEFTVWVEHMVHTAIASLHYAQEQHPIVIQMLTIMEESISDSTLCLKTLSTRIPLSTTYLGQLFRQETGMLFTSYLTETRISLAKQLLSSSNKRIHEIAEELGFNNQSYFNKVFKKLTGQTPAEFRRIRATLLTPSDKE